MAIIVLVLNAMVPFTGIPRLTMDILLGALAFTLSLMMLWYVADCPDGPEKVFWIQLRRCF
jgi:hypothetical protein